MQNRCIPLVSFFFFFCYTYRVTLGIECTVLQCTKSTVVEARKLILCLVVVKTADSIGHGTENERERYDKS